MEKKDFGQFLLAGVFFLLSFSSAIFLSLSHLNNLYLFFLGMPIGVVFAFSIIIFGYTMD